MRRLLIVMAIAFALVAPTTPAQAHHEDKYTAAYMKKHNPGLTVQQIQQNLNGFGYYTGLIDGSFGPKSRLAAAGHQDDWGHVKTAASVKRLQKIVGADQDGWYGPLTKEKLRQWQRKKGLYADGIAGRKTRTAMGLPVCQCGGH